MKLISSFAFAASAALAMNSAQAAVWVDVGPSSGFNILGHTVNFTGSPAAEIKYYNDNITPQSPANIQAVINTQFGLTGSNAVGAAVSACDNASSGCTAGTSAATVNSPLYSNSFTSAVAYDYLAIHFGKGELLFHWNTPIAAGTVFQIGGLPKGLSNYRAFSAPVPEAETYAMMMLGLGLVAVSVKRRRPV